MRLKIITGLTLILIGCGFIKYSVLERRPYLLQHNTVVTVNQLDYKIERGIFFNKVDGLHFLRKRRIIFSRLLSGEGFKSIDSYIEVPSLYIVEIKLHRKTKRWRIIKLLGPHTTGGLK